jgi:DNA-binding GntR family transcriptional regulator
VGKKCNTTQAKEFVLNRILSGEYKPGEHLREMVIANTLGVSQAPVREALRILQGAGYLIYKPRCGSIVADYSPKELIENYEIREALEVYAIRHHAIKISQDRFIREKLEELRNEFDLVNTIQEFSEVDYRFHSFLISLMDNKSVINHWNGVINQFKISSFFKETARDLNEFKSLHTNIIIPLIIGNTEEAALMLEEHYFQLKKEIYKSNEEV